MLCAIYSSATYTRGAEPDPGLESPGHCPGQSSSSAHYILYSIYIFKSENSLVTSTYPPPPQPFFSHLFFVICLDIFKVMCRVEFGVLLLNIYMLYKYMWGGGWG